MTPETFCEHFLKFQRRRGNVRSAHNTFRPLPEDAFAEFSLETADRRLLTEVGLPVGTAGMWTFDWSSDWKPARPLLPLDDLKRTRLARNELAGAPVGPRYRRYRVLGTNDDYEPLCLDTKTGRIVAFGPPEDAAPSSEPEEQLVNSTVRSLCRSILAVEALLEHGDAGRCRETIRADDPAAVEDGRSPWNRVIRWLERASAGATLTSAEPEPHPDSALWEHAKLGQVVDWTVETDRLRRFSRCGWNKRHVGEHLHPTFADGGRPLRPPAGERFRPTRRPRRSFEPQPIELEIQLPEGASEPSPAQTAALDTLFRQEMAILEAIGRSFQLDLRRGNLRDGAERQLGADADSLFALLDDPALVLSLVRFKKILVSPHTRGEIAVIGADGDCALDDEHGFGVQFAGNHVFEIGHATVGWSIYER
ncbi:SUKH-4 family immunity protein [Alienimonas chondri]|uniref:DUF6985 domain-containing protein n=1 Tax=Alienimonas chondri TaxID=2681879 RepID=A0ABX1VF39_9PLAN|nr:SUKH-4 family immunity protein [Alienimonas chondri]NNJ26697.1 hypothetical protein [Alienimonas chondri]